MGGGGINVAIQVSDAARAGTTLPSVCTERHTIQALPTLLLASFTWARAAARAASAASLALSAAALAA